MPEEKECVWCDRVRVLAGFLAGAGLAYMLIDVLFDGVLTKSLTKQAPRLASVINLPQLEGDADAG